MSQKNSRLAKRPDSSRPISLLHFQNAITSKAYDRFFKKILYAA